MPSRKQSQLTAIDLVTYAAADGQPDRFVTVGEEYMAPVVETIKEPALQQTLGHGVGFIHQGMLEADRKRVEGLYKDGVIKVRRRSLEVSGEGKRKLIVRTKMDFFFWERGVS